LYFVLYTINLNLVSSNYAIKGFNKNKGAKIEKNEKNWRKKKREEELHHCLYEQSNSQEKHSFLVYCMIIGS
jgi:hypothetical protein